MNRTDRAARVVRARPEEIYLALIDPTALLSWLPPRGMMGRFETFDARPGGRYRMTLTYEDPDHATPGKSTDDSDLVEGRFVEMTPGERLVQQIEFPSDDPAYAGRMKMTWSLTPVEGGTEVSIVCENVPEGIRQEDHQVGLNSSLENLAAFCEHEPR